MPPPRDSDEEREVLEWIQAILHKDPDSAPNYEEYLQDGSILSQ